MGLNQWMIPELTPEADFRLRAQELEITQAVQREPEAVANLAASLLRQSVIYEVMLRKATHRIAELEAREAIGQRGKAPEAEYLRMARKLRPVPWWVAMAWELMRLRRSGRR